MARLFGEGRNEEYNYILAISILIAVYNIVSLYMDDRR